MRQPLLRPFIFGAVLCCIYNLVLSRVFPGREPSLFQPSQLDPRIKIGSGNASWYGEPQIVSWRPFVLMYDNFLTEEECDYILKKSEPLMEPAMLVNDEGKHFMSTRRTSRGAFFDRGEDDIIAAIDQRIAHATQLPPENAEPLQVMTYLEKERYTAHVDYYRKEQRYFGTGVETFGGQRIVTALLYLTTAMGGETVFPRASTSNIIGRNSCAEKGVGVRPVKGRLVFFSDILPDGRPDNSSMHESCPVIRGQKTVVSRFIRSHACPLNKNFSKRKWNGNVECVDDHDRCAEFAARGDCTNEKRRAWMVGNERDPGWCEKTCNACDRPVEQSVLDMRLEMMREKVTPPAAVHEPALSTSGG